MAPSKIEAPGVDPQTRFSVRAPAIIHRPLGCGKSRARAGEIAEIERSSTAWITSPGDRTRRRRSNGRGPLGEALDGWRASISTGSGETPDRPRRRRISHSATSSSPAAGLRTPPTSSPRNTSAASWDRPRVSTPSSAMMGALAGTIAGWGCELGYFASDEDAETFEAELTQDILLAQNGGNSRSGSTWDLPRRARRAVRVSS